jgi:hypothetical protein
MEEKRMKATLRGSESRRCRELLRDAERRAVAIRKLLKLIGQRNGRRVRGVMDDAAKLAATIERLARWGQSCSAADAVEIESRIEVLISLLEVEIDRVLAS